MTCRLVLDEHLDLFIASALWERGHDALSIVGAGLRSASDEAIMEWAAAQDRVILTEDRRDFPRLVRQWNALGRDFPGVVLLSRGNFSRIDGLGRSIERHITADPERLQNSLTWLPPLLP